MSNSPERDDQALEIVDLEPGVEVEISTENTTPEEANTGPPNETMEGDQSPGESDIESDSSLEPEPEMDAQDVVNHDHSYNIPVRDQRDSEDEHDGNQRRGN